MRGCENQIMNFQYIHTYVLCYSMQGVINSRCVAPTWQVKASTLVETAASLDRYLHTKLTTVVPFVEANMWDSAYLTTLRTDPVQKLMPSQHKQILNCLLQLFIFANDTFEVLMFSVFSFDALMNNDCVLPAKAWHEKIHRHRWGKTNL